MQGLHAKGTYVIKAAEQVDQMTAKEEDDNNAMRSCTCGCGIVSTTGGRGGALVAGARGGCKNDVVEHAMVCPNKKDCMQMDGVS